MGEPLLEIRGLCKSYGALHATDHFDLEIEAGEVHALIGPNGAGKSTLIGLLAGELAPDAGTIHFGGRDVTRLPVHARSLAGIGRSFQITNLFPDFTVLENAVLAIQAHAGSSFRCFSPAMRDPALVDPAQNLLAGVGLGKRAALRVASLSHGEQRQLELALAMAGSPRLLLLDEPTSGMGREDTLAIVERLKALRGRMAIFLVEHDMDAVFALADRITVLVYGRKLATGHPDEIRAHPDVRAAYLGAIDPGAA